MTNFRFFTWKADGDWTPHQLLSEQVIADLVRAFKWKREVFASIQRFNEQGVAQGCPLFLDFDGKDALEDARFAYHIIKDSLWIEPRVYFSGNKGYHVVADVEIPGDNCHLVAKAIVERMTGTWKSLDKSIYTSRRMWRLPGSPASKPGYYKVRLSPELLDYGTDLHQSIASQVQQPWGRESQQTLNEKTWSEWLGNAQATVAKQSLSQPAPTTQQGEWTHCMDVMLKSPATERHNTAFLVARGLAKSGLSEPEILAKFLSFDHWRVFEEQERGISKVVHGVMKYSNHHIGCKTGIAGELMRKHCDPFCIFADGSLI